MQEHPYFLDPSHWASEDKEWLAARKLEWKNIQHVLKIRGKYIYSSKGYMKEFKAFFFTGKFRMSSPPQRIMKAGNGYFTPLTIIWFHPNLCSAVSDSIVEFHSDNARSAHRLGCGPMFLNARDSEYDRSYGMMGGREKSVVDILCSQKTLGIMDKYEVSYRSYLGGTSAPRFLYDGLIHVLKGGTNPWHPGQYIWEHALPYLDDVLKTDEARAENYLTLCKYVCHFDQHRGAAKDNQYAVALRADLMARFQQLDSLPAELTKLWNRAVIEGPE